jgi:hypothetical protein
MNAPAANIADPIFYKLQIKKWILIICCIFALTVGFLRTFPLENKLKTLLQSQAKAIPGCSIDFSSLTYNLVIPQIRMNDVVMSPMCMGKAGKDFSFPEIVLGFQGLSFAPIGPLFGGRINFQGEEIRFKTAIGLGSTLIRIEEEEISLKKLMPLVSESFRLDGKIVLNSVINLGKDSIQSMSLMATSKNLVIPAQSLLDGMLAVPNINFGDFSLKLSMDIPGKLRVEEMILGKSQSPVRTKFKGIIELAKSNIQNSPVDLTGETFITQDFLDKNAVLNLFLNQFTQKDGYYQIRLGGTLGQIKPSAI